MGYYETLYGSYPTFMITLNDEVQGQNPDYLTSKNSMSKATSSQTPQQSTTKITELPSDTLGTTLPRLYTEEETAEYLGLKVKKVQEHVRNGKLQCVQLSARDRMFTEEQIKDFLQRRTIPLPKPLDRKPREQVRYSPERRKSSGGSSVRALRKEIHSW
jgi:excisionase family DNA binding protein